MIEKNKKNEKIDDETMANQLPTPASPLEVDPMDLVFEPEEDDPLFVQLKSKATMQVQAKRNLVVAFANKDPAVLFGRLQSDPLLPCRLSSCRNQGGLSTCRLRPPKHGLAVQRQILPSDPSCTKQDILLSQLSQGQNPWYEVAVALE